MVGLALAAVVVVDAREKQADVHRADAVAAQFEEQVNAFRGRLDRDLRAIDATDPRLVARVLARHRDDVPVLGGAPERGVAGSAAYGAARSEQSTLVESLDHLDDVVGKVRAGVAYVTAARRALGVDPTTFSPASVVRSGAPLRSQLLPPMRSTAAQFEAVDPPRGAGEVRRLVSAALRHVISEAEQLATQLDAGQSGSFTYSQQYAVARRATDEYEVRLRADLREAVDAVVGTEDPAGSSR